MFRLGVNAKRKREKDRLVTKEYNSKMQLSGRLKKGDKSDFLPLFGTFPVHSRGGLFRKLEQSAAFLCAFVSEVSFVSSALVVRHECLFAFGKITALHTENLSQLTLSPVFFSVKPYSHLRVFFSQQEYQDRAGNPTFPLQHYTQKRIGFE